MSSCVFDPVTLEATSTLEFLPHLETDYCGPYYHDGSCHVSGFVCNAVEEKKDQNAFISNGVTAMKLSPLFDPAKKGTEIRYVRPMNFGGVMRLLICSVPVTTSR